MDVIRDLGLFSLSGVNGGRPLLPTFEQPIWLLLIPVLWVGAWWISRKSLAGGGSARALVHLLLRCLVIALIAGAMSEPRVRWEADDVAVVAVVDVSDSVPGDQQKRVAQFLSSSLNWRKSNDRLGVVTVARQALVQTLPTSKAPTSAIGFSGHTDASNLRQGLDLAKALIPPDAAGRVLLLSDGNETGGSIAGAASSLIAAGIPLDVVSVDYDSSAMVKVEDVIVPAWARDGETVTVRVLMNSSVPIAGRLSLVLNGTVVDLDPSESASSARLDLPAGRRVVAQQLRLPPGPVHRFEAVFEPDDPKASVPQLLSAQAVTFTGDRGRVLVIASDADAARPLVEAFSSDNLNVQAVTPARAPVEFEEWAAYDAVVFVDQSAWDYSQEQQRDLARAIHDAGTGWLMVGGPNTFGAGGWIGSPLEDSMPVRLDPPQKRQIQMGALALMIDRSGSMDATVSGTGMNQQQIANEAAVLGMNALSRLDQVCVIAFSDGADVVVPLVYRTQSEEIERRIKSVRSGGGTNVFPGIDAAADELAKSPAGVKHIIVLTDGMTGGGVAEGLKRAEELRKKGITISTVSIGDYADDPLLEELAKSGGGRRYQVKSENSMAVLPQIFIKETQTIRRSLIWEGNAFTPKIENVGEAMQGLHGPLPGISGYVVTAERGGLATVSLSGPEGDPILAQWQHGLGRAVAYTSDAMTRWNAGWVAWGSYSSFWKQQLRWAMRPVGDPNARVTVNSDGDVSKVVLDLTDADGERMNFATVRARVVEPGKWGQGASDVPFRQVSPGRYEATVEAAKVGSHLLSIRYDAAGVDGGRSGSVRAAIVRKSGEEFRSPTPNKALLWQLARQTNGRIHTLDPAGTDLWVRDDLKMPVTARPIWLALAVAGLAVFLMDVAARRVAIDPQKVLAWAGGLFVPATPKGRASLSTLADVRARTAAVLAERGRAGGASVARQERASESGAGSRMVASAETQVTKAISQDSPAALVAPAKPPTGTEAGLDAMKRLKAAKDRARPS